MVARVVQLSVFAALLLLALNVEAAVTASVDRADVEINESFTLKVLDRSECVAAIVPWPVVAPVHAAVPLRPLDSRPVVAAALPAVAPLP